MSSLKEDYSLMMETLIGIFTADKGKIKILMMRKKTEPYKGYWILPGEMLNKDETLVKEQIPTNGIEATSGSCVYLN